jgi:hypothetical protein
MQDNYEERLRAKLAPERIRATLSYAGLVLIVYEEIKNAVVNEVRNFYTMGVAFDEAEYARDVLSLDRSRFRASAKWLHQGDAITEDQIDVLERLYKHRKDIAHELMKYLIDVDHDLDADLFIEALGVLKDIRRFWTQMEIDFGMFEAHGDVSVDDVAPLSMMVLQNVLDAWVESIQGVQRPGEEGANE